MFDDEIRANLDRLELADLNDPFTLRGYHGVIEFLCFFFLHLLLLLLLIVGLLRFLPDFYVHQRAQRQRDRETDRENRTLPGRAAAR